MLRRKPSEIDRDEFLEVYGGVYEHSPWIAEQAWEMREGDHLDSVDGLHAAMQLAVEQAEEEAQLALICAHPDLACAPAEQDKLTQESQSEQAGAGLKECTPEEFEAFQALNKSYRETFGFPFIIAVKGMHRGEILQMFRERSENPVGHEFKTALAQIHKIARFRLEALSEEFAE